MEIQIKQKDVILLFICLGLGILAEVSFLHGRIGVSYLVFISGFYLVIFLRYGLSFNHRRIGLLFMIAIWILSGSFLFYDNEFFRGLNILVIPVLVFSHIILITSSNTFKWNTPRFAPLMINKLVEGSRYIFAFCSHFFKKVFKNMNEQTAQAIKRIMIGLAIGVPLLFIIIFLLMSADTVFEDIVLRLPEFIVQFNFMDSLFRIIFVIIVGFLFFGIFQVLHSKSVRTDETDLSNKNKPHWDSIIAITILVMLNAVYVLFTVVQFKYFFSEQLMDGFTYAEYARKGFFELIIVMLINWTLLISFLTFVQTTKRNIKLTLNSLYSLLIVVSGIMLASAYQRLSMYEAAYGFTLDRILAHAFMIFLIVIFAYTFIKVWLEHLSLLHFYLITGLIFYTALNAINLQQIIVDKNLDRYEQTDKIDIYYFHNLSYTGLEGLIELYELDGDYPELREILRERKKWEEEKPEVSWQSFNFAKQRAIKKLENLDLKESNR